MEGGIRIKKMHWLPSYKRTDVSLTDLRGFSEEVFPPHSCLTEKEKEVQCPT